MSLENLRYDVIEMKLAVFNFLQKWGIIVIQTFYHVKILPANNSKLLISTVVSCSELLCIKFSLLMNMKMPTNSYLSAEKFHAQLI